MEVGRRNCVLAQGAASSSSDSSSTGPIAAVLSLSPTPRRRVPPTLRGLRPQCRFSARSSPDRPQPPPERRSLRESGTGGDHQRPIPGSMPDRGPPPRQIIQFLAASFDFLPVHEVRMVRGHDGGGPGQASSRPVFNDSLEHILRRAAQKHRRVRLLRRLGEQLDRREVVVGSVIPPPRPGSTVVSSPASRLESESSGGRNRPP